MLEFKTTIAGGRDHNEMGEAVASMMAREAADGWEPISFTPIGFKFVQKDFGDPQGNNISNYRLITTVQQIIFRRSA